VIVQISPLAPLFVVSHSFFGAERDEGDEPLAVRRELRGDGPEREVAARVELSGLDASEEM
jgi:hypothetical protein